LRSNAGGRSLADYRVLSIVILLVFVALYLAFR
jgi:hypothetical protein